MYQSSRAPDRLKRYVPRALLGYRTAWLACRNVLKHQGLYHTIRSGRPVRPDGSPIPWFTFPAIEFLDQFDFSEADVFEYGSGNSTLYWQDRVGSLVSIEDDAEWFEEVGAGVKSDVVDYRMITDPEAYVAAIVGGSYDVIIIDGSHRERCVEPAANALKPGGFIVLDNSDWFPGAAAVLRSCGLIEVDFAGIAPLNAYTSTTSLFLQPSTQLRPMGLQPKVGAGGMPENVRPAS